MTGLFCAKKVSGAADFKVAHGDLEARTERRIFADGRQALLRDLAQRLAPAVAQIGIGVARGTADTAANLVQLRQTIESVVQFVQGAASGTQSAS